MLTIRRIPVFIFLLFWVANAEDFIRITPGKAFETYGDYPSPREISDVIFAINSQKPPDERGRRIVLTFFGQLLDHEITITETTNPPIRADIVFGNITIPFVRNHPLGNPTNHLTSILDGGAIYGNQQSPIRAFQGGLLNSTSLQGLEVPPLNSRGMHITGDVRGNENSALLILHSIFLQIHNSKAREIQRNNPQLTDEEIYQQTRRYVVAVFQYITLYEFLPILLGNRNTPPKYRGYRPNVDPRLTIEFSTAIFRYGHTQLDDTLDDCQGAPVRLNDTFMNPSLTMQRYHGLLCGIFRKKARHVEPKVTNAVRNFLFRTINDLVSLNIQRGRDHGLALYNDLRRAYGLRRKRNFNEVTSDSALAQKLAQLYQTVDRCEVFVCGLSEDHVRDSALGELFTTAIAEQFGRIRDGDPNWYERSNDKDFIREVEKISFLPGLERERGNPGKDEENYTPYYIACAGGLAIVSAAGFGFYRRRKHIQNRLGT